MSILQDNSSGKNDQTAPKIGHRGPGSVSSWRMSSNHEALTAAVTAARAGHLAGFARLVELTESMAYSVAFGVLRREADAQDAVQEAFLTAFRQLSELVESEAFAGWLRRI